MADDEHEHANEPELRLLYELMENADWLERLAEAEGRRDDAARHRVRHAELRKQYNAAKMFSRVGMSCHPEGVVEGEQRGDD